jgi:ubiquinone/menaquinone biosynthesis C-methylase UbiE
MPNWKATKMGEEMQSKNNAYLMESQEEIERLERKTDMAAVIRQASWAGIGPGMRVLDVGCGSGVTTAALAELVGPSGSVTGIDYSAERIEHARQSYGSERVEFVCHDISAPYLPSQSYDAVWSRFFLEYFKTQQRQIFQHSTAALRKGGIACIADLDNNNLNHHGLSDRLMETIKEVLLHLQENHDFDPYAGRKLYGHFLALGYEEIRVTGELHHLGYGVACEDSQFNWLQKLDIGAKNSGCDFSAYEGDYQEFRAEFEKFLTNPERFTYSPLIIVRGLKVR